MAMSAPSLIPRVALFRQLLSSSNHSITGCHFHSSTPTIASQEPVHEEFVKRLLDRRWMLPTPETKVHQVKLLVNPKTKNDKRRFGDIRFFNNPNPCLLGGEDAAGNGDGIGKSFYVVRDDLLHPLINGNKARKLDALFPLLEQHGFTDVVTCGGCQSAHTAALCNALFVMQLLNGASVTCAERGLNSHLLLRGEQPEILTGYNLIPSIYGTVTYVPQSLYAMRDNMLKKHAEAKRSHLALAKESCISVTLMERCRAEPTVERGQRAKSIHRAKIQSTLRSDERDCHPGFTGEHSRSKALRFWSRTRSPTPDATAQANLAVYCVAWPITLGSYNRIVHIGNMAEPVRVTPFDGTSDFTMWKAKMKAILIKEKCWDAVAEDWQEGATKRYKRKLRDLAHSEIILRLSDDVARQVVSHTNPKNLWDALESIFLAKSLPNRISLLVRLFTFKMDTSITLQENLDLFLKVTQELKRCDDEIKPTHQAVILLNSLPPQFENLKDVIQHARDDMTMTKIMSALVQKNDSLKVFKTKHQTKGEPKSEVMMAKTKFRPKNKNKKFNKPPLQNGNPSTNNNLAGRSQEYLSKKCTHCGRIGHLVNTCFKKKNEQKEKHAKDNQNGVNMLEMGPQYRNEMFVCSGSMTDSDWILDSGCTMHACHDKSVFTTMKHVNGGEVMLGDHTSLKIQGIGTVPIKLHDGVTRVLTNVKWVPNLRRNLLSESEFDKMGCHIITFNGIREISKDGKVLIKGVNRGGLYHVITSSEINVSKAITESDNLTKLWHARLGHICNKGLHYLYKHELINCVPSKLSFCESCGPAQVSTIGGKNSFLSMIDHYSRKVWICLLRSKDESFENFKMWKIMVESQYNIKVKCLRTDNGLEFCNKAFNQFCAEQGIRRHHTVLGTPQQNGVAERMNRTLLAKARCMLISSGFKPSVWGEAVHTAAYLINRSPCSAIDFKTPQEKCSGKPPSLGHLRPFGCAAYAKVSQGKLKPRAVKCVMLGYPEGVKGYKLLEIVLGGYKVITAISVTFNEQEFHFKNKSTSETNPQTHLLV
ncbi:unnamed protein product [Rhodiola kirilowii]